MHAPLAALVLLIGSACVVGDPEADPGGDDGDQLDSLAAAAVAPADSFNRPGVHHVLDYVRLNKSNVQLRDASFAPIGATVSNSLDSKGHLSVRVQGIEAVTTPDGTLYYAWGMNGFKSGFIHVADLEQRPVIDPSARAGNGSACDIRTAANGERKSYFVRPKAIPGSLRYRGPVTGFLHSFTHYGTPGAPEVPGYTYLSWSWINKVGGGIVRSIVPDGDVFYPCAVASITSPSLQAPGWVRVIYGMTYQGGNRLFGWIVHSHQAGTAAPVMHLDCKNC